MTGILMASVGNSYGSAPVNTVAPAVTGTATVGQTLSSTTGTWTGAPAPTFAYQWQRAGSNIGGATSSTYVLVSADAGSTIRCVVTATNSVAPGGVSANSNSTASVTEIPANTVAPAVSGTAQVPNVISTTNGTWTGTPSPTFTYQWQRNTTNIGGETASTYTLQAADVGSTVRCVVTGTNSVGAVSANSNSTATVTAAPTYLNVTNTSGASVTTSGNYKIAVYDGAGSFGVSSVGSGSSESATIEYLVIAGGGGGGNQEGGGGGGAGGFLANGTNNQTVTAQTYTITVGGGGSFANGTNSSIGSLIVSTGGSYWPSGTAGGSGGGGLGAGQQGGGQAGRSGTAGQGNAGGTGYGVLIVYNGKYGYPVDAGGGGGGAGGAGASAGYAAGGNGGSGAASSITGSSVTYAGGGGGGSGTQTQPTTTGGAGGAGGGGKGDGKGTGSAVAGTVNTGGGGGGSQADGGSGKVVIKWRFQ